ncbi:uncharacterized protein LOC144628748 [Oculina patagonica]
MDSREEIIVTVDIAVALVVATFLLNTGRVLKAIELCKESLVLLNNKVLSVKQQFGTLICKRIYKTMFKAFCRIHDDKNAITYGRKLLVIYCECGETVSEGYLSIILARIYQGQSKYVDAKELNERAITIMKEIGNKNGEAMACGNLGAVFQSLGDYCKAKEYHEKSLAIYLKIGDKAGKAANYGNLGTLFNSLGDYVKAKEYHEKSLAIYLKIGDSRKSSKLRKPGKCVSISR